MPTPRPRSPTPQFNGQLSQNGIGLGQPSMGGRGRKSGFKSRATQLLALRFGWVVLVVWYEVGEFFHSLSSCKFPDSQIRGPASTSYWTRKPISSPAPTHLVLLADPHVPHPRLSYSPESRPWVNMLRQTMDELFMRKSWNVVMRLGRVDGIIVLGDMLDWGRGVMSDPEYESYFSLFKSIFQHPPHIPMYYVPGNHDIPLGPHGMFSPHARERYSRHFSPPNAILQVANHSLILLDAVGLVEEEYMRYASEMQFGEWNGVKGGVIEFVRELGDDPPPGPKVLISHIPLARPEAASCGPHREYGRILKGAGPGYQNLVGSDTSRFLLEVLKPSIVFSGDDHDYCDFTHPGGIREVTLKSFSSSTGIRRPGFQLLSLVPPSSVAPYTNQRTFADRPCFLPDQVGVYTWVYLPLAILTILFLLGTNVRAAWLRWTMGSNPGPYGDVKSRLSPNLLSTETMPTMSSARRANDRPAPFSLPSRTSNQNLFGLTPNTASSILARPSRIGSFVDLSSSCSAPVSPSASPRPSYAEDRDHESILDSPGLSRRSSYANLSNLDPYSTPGGGGRGFDSHNGSSYDYPGFGLITTNGNGNGSYPYPQLDTGTMERSISSGAPPGSVSNSPSGGFTSRRNPIPRMLSTSDWSAAAKAKDKTVIELVVDSLPIPGSSRRRGGGGGGGGSNAMKGFFRWAWKARNGVVGKSWKEVMAVAWPPAIVWIVINGLFFIG